MKQTLSILFLFVVVTAPLRAVNEKEFIVVSGGPSLYQWERFKYPPHDRWWANFIRSASVRIKEIQAEQGANARITWLVYRPAYERRLRQNEGPLLSNIESVAKKNGARLVWFNSTDQLINYLNAGQPRDRVKIANLEFFLHSNKACFMFDYSNEIDSGSKAWLHETELNRISRASFAPKAFVKSWGCHTGESMSKKWKRATGTRMIGAVGKTDYAPGPSPRLSRGGRWSG
jgi:hypothetical protein